MARCGHPVSKSYSRAHHGLCRKCHSNFAYLVELEEKCGEDALVEYWFAMIIANLSDNRRDADSLIDHVIDFYQRKLVETTSKQRYIQKMLFMLHSIKEPFDARKMA
jgi:RNA polymerase subunit RPABC4/transcription elongation factor Spt4